MGKFLANQIEASCFFSVTLAFSKVSRLTVSILRYCLSLSFFADCFLSSGFDDAKNLGLFALVGDLKPLLCLSWLKISRASLLKTFCAGIAFAFITFYFEDENIFFEKRIFTVL